MARKIAGLQRIECNEPITMENNYEFLYQLQSTLLLALREQGLLSPMQHRYADECLKKQRWNQAKRKQEGP